jgi:hypothetical protein
VIGMIGMPDIVGHLFSKDNEWATNV